MSILNTFGRSFGCSVTCAIALGSLSSPVQSFGGDKPEVVGTIYPWAIVNECASTVKLAYAIKTLVRGWVVLAPGESISGDTTEATIGFAVELENGVWRPGPTKVNYHAPLITDFAFWADEDGGNSGKYTDAIWIPFYEYDTRVYPAFYLCSTYPPE